MAKALSLLEQVRIREKEAELNAKRAVNSSMNGLQMLNILLPNYKPLPKAALFHAASQRTKVLLGGVRSSKTYSLEANAILLSYLNRPYYHLSMSPSFGLAEKTVVKVMEEHCELNNLQYHWSKGDQEFRIIWGKEKRDIATILVIGAEQTFKGITAASGDVNEPFSCPEPSYLVWYERISHPKAVRFERNLGGTAEPEKMTWGHKYYKMKTNSNIFLETMTTYENTYLSPLYIKDLEDQYDVKLRRVYLMGENINLSGSNIYYCFDEQLNVIPYQGALERIRSNITNTVVLSFDFNVNPICAVETWVNGPERIQIDEYRISTSNTWEITELVMHRIKERYDLDKTLFIITGDATGQKSSTRSKDVTENDYTIIKRQLDTEPKIKYTFRVPDSNPFVSDRVKYINRQFEKKLFSITDNCKYSTEDRNLMKWKQGGEGLIVDKSNKSITHLADAGDYALWNTKILNESELESSNKIYTHRTKRSLPKGSAGPRFIRQEQDKLVKEWTALRVESYLNEY